MIQNIFSTPIQEFHWSNTQVDPSNILDITNNIVFIQFILDSAKEYAQGIGKRNGYLICRDIWIRTMRQSHSYVPLHDHPGSWAVGTFYLDDGQGDLVLVDPRGYTSEWNWTEMKDIDGNNHSSCTDFYYTPKKNTCIMFPAYIKHMVLPSNKERTRTAISWNISFEESLDTINFLGVDNSRYIEI